MKSNEYVFSHSSDFAQDSIEQISLIYNRPVMLNSNSDLALHHDPQPHKSITEINCLKGM